jgi:hypothetical protein
MPRLRRLLSIARSRRQPGRSRCRVADLSGSDRLSIGVLAASIIATRPAKGCLDRGVIGVRQPVMCGEIRTPLPVSPAELSLPHMGQLSGVAGARQQPVGFAEGVVWYTVAFVNGRVAGHNVLDDSWLPLAFR